jgi:hypothetical protein
MTTMFCASMVIVVEVVPSREPSLLIETQA